MTNNEIKIIPMTYDKMFKSVLTSKEGRWYLVDLISNITKIKRSKIEKNIVFKNSEHQIIGIGEKKKISDLVVEVKECVINLEMNKEYYEGIENRNYAYISKIRESMIGEAEEYKDIKKTIQINFDNYNRYKPDKRVVIKFEMLDKEKLIKEGIEIENYHVILPNVREKYYNEKEEKTLLRELMIMMVENDKELEKLIKDNMELKKVGEKIVEISRDEELNGWYDEEEHKRKVRNTMMKSAIEEGWKEGKEKGLKEGLEQGIKQGIEQGLELGIKGLIKKLLEEKVDLDIICKTTGYTKEQIDEIRN